MPHQSQLEKKKYRNWVQAGLGLKYVKEGLQSFSEDIVQQQHDDMINNIKQNKKLSTVTCGQCHLRDLMPDHMKIGNRQCPLDQVNCNCWNPAGKIPCPNNVCGAIYDQIIKAHRSTPPVPYWKNTDIQKWSTDPWSVAKCFINAPGYDRKSSAAEIDCTGLLHLIINNKEFHSHIQCLVTGTDVFSKVRDCRNKIFHSSTMELDDADVKSYIADMKAVLQDGMELKHRHDSQAAVTYLQELEKEDFIITTKCEAEVFSASVEAIKARQRELEEKINDSEKKSKDIEDNLPTKNDLGHIEKRMRTLESYVSEQNDEIKKIKEDQLRFKEELEKLRVLQSSQKDRNDYVQTKLEFRRELMEFYKEKLLKVSILPLNPRKNVTEFTNVYIKPQMVTERNKPQVEHLEERTISSMHEMFEKDVRSIYVVGEAGSGKSSFCKSLVNFWCLAYSEQQTTDNGFGGIDAMRKFEFLFHIPLSHNSDKTRIREMLCKIYGRPVLEKILDNESRTCLIILDGLDEWNPGTTESLPFQTEGLPIREYFKNYTVITTSRPWKLETLQIADNEMQLKIRLKELSEVDVRTMIERTVSVLNESFEENKLADDCEKQIKEMSVSDVKHTPIMLQQLICLWFDGKLHGTSRCAIYSAMLELFFEWNAKKSQNDPCFVEMRKRSTDTSDVKLPEPLFHIEACRSYKYLIDSMSRLAFETLFNIKKEMSMSFDSSLFKRFNVSEDTKSCCLKLGILSEDKEESLTASQRQSSKYSFVHKSEQEFLAAVYISIQAKPLLEKAALPDNSLGFLNNYFGCVTVNDILDKANVFIMLCGLETRLAMNISEYMYNIVTNDKRVLTYRNSVPLYTEAFRKSKHLISSIQNCIYTCIEEVLVWDTSCESMFHLGDIIIGHTETDCQRFALYCNKKMILPNSVMSFGLETMRLTKAVDFKNIHSAFKYMADCCRLAAIKINIWFLERDLINEETVQSICNTLTANTATLKSIFVRLPSGDEVNPIYDTLIRCLPSMVCLMALQIKGFNVSHEHCSLLGSFLSQTKRLEQISIDIRCDCRQEHNLDLSKHENLQSLEISKTFCLTPVHTSSLEDFIYYDITERTIEQIENILTTAYKLKKLQLGCYRILSIYHETITKKLIALLSSMQHLYELSLDSFTFTDNIIACSSKMKDLEHIYLPNVAMGLTTWRRFVDSLIVIPHGVTVWASMVYITKDGAECNRDNNAVLKEGGEEKAAFQYVRKQEKTFDVQLEQIMVRSICFSTKK